MTEHILKIGKPVPLACVLTEPDQRKNPDVPGVILLNSGVMHHIGTCRMSVRICRAMSDAGIPAARFDLSGIGDSASRSGTGSFREVARAEVSEVMDYLESTRQLKKFVLVGLCSGADAAYEAALVDDRVVGICQLDAYVYRNLRYYLTYYGPRLFKPDVWRRFFKRTFAPEKRERISEEFVELPSYVRVFPPRTEIEAGLRKIVDKGIELYNIFTGGQDDCIIYEGQYRDNFASIDFKDQLKVDLYSDCSHIVMEPAYQEKIVADVLEWYMGRCLKEKEGRGAPAQVA